MECRTIDISGEAVRRHRLKKAWSPERLASASGCSLRTILNIERSESKAVYVATLNKIAKALDVPMTSLFSTYPDGIDKQPPGIPWINNVNVIFQGDFQDFDESDQLREILSEIHQKFAGRAKIVVLSITEANSIAVLLAMTEEDCLRLVKAYCDKTLAEFHIEAITVPISTRAAINNYDDVMINPTPTMPEIVRVQRFKSFPEYLENMMNQNMMKFKIVLNRVVAESKAFSNLSISADDDTITIRVND